MGRPRSYSDHDLTEAVAGSQSWRGVLRALGLVATSSSAIRSVKRHADELGLEYQHFTGQRRWTDDQLKSAVARANNWDDVVDILGLRDGSNKVTLRAHAARLSIDVSHLQTPSSDATPSSLSMGPDPAHLSRSGALLAAA